MIANYKSSVLKQFEYYKLLAEKAMMRVSDDRLFWQSNEDSNSIATIIKHLHGNMMSRWTDFLTSDGEKEWRIRDAEFENDLQTRDQLRALWIEGWDCCLNSINALTESDFEKTIYIRNQGHTVIDAINRQLAHYPYHVGQIVFLAKMLCGKEWTSLSIPKGKSNIYNADKFAQPKHNAHFTDEFLRKE